MLIKLTEYILPKIKSIFLKEHKTIYNEDIEEIIPYIVIDNRKIKFTEYSKAESFYELSYERMNKAIAIGSKFALKANCNKEIRGIFRDEEYTYYFKLINNTDNFGIINVEKIEDRKDDLYYDEDITRNNKNN